MFHVKQPPNHAFMPLVILAAVLGYWVIVGVMAHSGQQLVAVGALLERGFPEKMPVLPPLPAALPSGMTFAPMPPGAPRP